MVVNRANGASECLIDSGATGHYDSDASGMKNLKTLVRPKIVTVANNQRLLGKQVGQKGDLQNVTVLLGINKNLLSVGQSDSAVMAKLVDT